MPSRVIPTILVIGGGFAGRSAIKYLIENAWARIILIDDKPFFEFTPSILRCITHPDHLHNVTFPQDSIEEVQFIRGRVTHITANEAYISRLEEDREVINSVPFDYCVWATGVGFSTPIRSSHSDVNLQKRRTELSLCRHQIVSASNILIVGGGTVGVEFAAEVLAIVGHSETELTIAASERGLLPRLPSNASRYAEFWFKKRGVRILYKRLRLHHIDDSGLQYYQDELSSSVSICADLVFDCTGAKSNRSYGALIAGGLCSQDDVNTDGSIRVLNTLQLREASHIFVAGDASRVEDELDIARYFAEKTAYAAEAAGRLAARNLCLLMKSESRVDCQRNRLYKYPMDVFPFGHCPRLFVVSLYKYHGILSVGPLVITGFFPSIVKYFIETLGVGSAESNCVSSLILELSEKVMYFIAFVFTTVHKMFRRSIDR